MPTIGRESGACYPTTDQTAIAGGRRSGFQFGTFTWLEGRSATEAQCGAKPIPAAPDIAAN